ncbi:MAG: ABC transporter ATP-binding protein, partial [Neisseriaceae bacterium]|nr:ABC transporter ATP-binding protein [Neisseriaceae bacterium]
SHDRMFLDNVITQSIVFEGNGSLKEYVGGYQDYLDAKTREQNIQAAHLSKTEAPHNEPKEKIKNNRSIKLSFNEQRELTALPEQINDLETEQAEINQQLSNPEIFRDYEKAGALQQRAETIENELLEKLERWEYLENKQQGILME